MGKASIWQTDVHNPEKCGYNHVTATFSHLIGIRGLRCKNLNKEISCIYVWEDNTQYHRYGGGSLQFLLTASGLMKVEWDVELDIVLNNGTSIELWTCDKDVLKAALPFIQKKDMRLKGRIRRSL